MNEYTYEIWEKPKNSKFWVDWEFSKTGVVIKVIDAEQALSIANKSIVENRKFHYTIRNLRKL